MLREEMNRPWVRTVKITMMMTSAMYMPYSRTF
jgi:hypothetical protein